MGKINFNNLFYLTHYIQNIIISPCNQYLRIINGYFAFIFMQSLQNQLYFTLIALNLYTKFSLKILNLYLDS